MNGGGLGGKTAPLARNHARGTLRWALTRSNKRISPYQIKMRQRGRPNPNTRGTFHPKKKEKKTQPVEEEKGRTFGGFARQGKRRREGEEESVGVEGEQRAERRRGDGDVGCHEHEHERLREATTVRLREMRNGSSNWPPSWVLSWFHPSASDLLSDPLCHHLSQSLYNFWNLLCYSLKYKKSIIHLCFKNLPRGTDSGKFGISGDFAMLLMGITVRNWNNISSYK